MGEYHLTHAKNCFQLCLKTSFGKPLTFHQQLIKYFPFKNWLNFLALKIKKLLERRLKRAKRRKGKAGTEPRGSAFEEHSRALHRNSSGFGFWAVFPLWTELPEGSKYPIAGEKFNGVKQKKPESPNNGRRITREDVEL